MIKKFGEGVLFFIQFTGYKWHNCYENWLFKTISRMPPNPYEIWITFPRLKTRFIQIILIQSSYIL